MPVMHLKQTGFTYSACRQFTKNKERMQKYIYQNELDKICFQHDKTYGDFKDLNRTAVSHKILSNKTFNVAKNRKQDKYQRSLASIVYNVFD